MQLSDSKYRLLIMLVSVDLVLLVLYAMYGFKLVSDPKFGLIEDWSYGEVYQYIKEIWIILLIGFTAWSRQSFRYAVWIPVFLFLLLDDSCQLHERAGQFLAESFQLPTFGAFRAQDSGELLYAAGAGLVVLLGVALSFRHVTADYRKWATKLIYLLLGLVFFGVVVDMLQFESYWIVEKGIGAVEDGGEQLVMSCIVWFVYLHSMEQIPTPDDE